MKFESKVALVTGGGAGIGRATVLALAAEGAKVAIGNRNAEQGQQIVAEVERNGGEALFVRTDVTEPAQIAALVEQTVARFGALHLAFNNAGYEGPLGSTHEVDFEKAKYVIDVNVVGVLASMQLEIPRILESGGGAIVNTSSIVGSRAMPGAGPYVASKFAVNGLTRAAALEYATQGLRVNAVAPGPIETKLLEDFSGGNTDQLAQMVPMKRLGQPDEIAAAVVWLLSDEAAFVTGEVLTADGGWSAG